MATLVIILSFFVGLKGTIVFSTLIYSIIKEEKILSIIVNLFYFFELGLETVENIENLLVCK